MSHSASDSRREPDRPEVSVVIPVYNGASTLAETVDSAFAQSLETNRHVGRRGHVIDRKSSSREPQAWLTIDSSNGVLSGTPTAPGYNVVIVVARRGEGDEARIDARRVVVVVEK